MMTLREKTAFLKSFGATPIYGGWRWTYKVDVTVKDGDLDTLETAQKTQIAMLEQIQDALTQKIVELEHRKLQLGGVKHD